MSISILVTELTDIKSATPPVSVSEEHSHVQPGKNERLKGTLETSSRHKTELPGNTYLFLKQKAFPHSPDLLVGLLTLLDAVGKSVCNAYIIYIGVG